MSWDHWDRRRPARPSATDNLFRRMRLTMSLSERALCIIACRHSPTSNPIDFPCWKVEPRMNSRLPRWLLITLLALAVVVLVTGLVLMIRSSIYWVHLTGFILSGVLIVLLVLFVSFSAPQLIKLYKFQKYFKQHEAQLKLLPSLMQTGRTQEALMRFEGVMKHAPDNAYLYYMRASFLKAGGKLPEAMAAANKALSLIDKDPFLPQMLQQVGGQMGQPTTVAEFREQLEELRRTLTPRVSQMRERHDKAVEKRKRKSR